MSTAYRRTYSNVETFIACRRHCRDCAMDELTWPFRLPVSAG
jgi:hypothetical protein